MTGDVVQFESYRKCASIVRGMYPKAPKLPAKGE